MKKILPGSLLFTVYRFIARHLSSKQIKAMKKRMKRVLSLWPSAANLSLLALRHGTDKWTHGYIQYYEKYFSKIRLNRMRMLEIGIGGFSDPNAGGESLRMWRDYFPHSIIYGIDKYDKRSLEEERIHVFQGSQDDPAFLKGLVEKAGSVDIVIDDGSHLCKDVISSFNTLFPLLATGGIYVIEDLQTSYIPQYGGNSVDLACPETSVGVLKALVDGLNYAWIPDHAPTYLDQNTVSVHFYPKLAFVFKGTNKLDPRVQIEP